MSSAWFFQENLLRDSMVIIFCGVPGTGKSTVVKKLANLLRKKGSVRFFISDQIPGQRYKRIFNLLRESLDKTDYILIDGTFYKKKWREEIKEIAGKENVFTCYLHCSLKSCLERNKGREPSVPDKATYIIEKEMEKPQEPDISIDTDEVNPEEAVSQILRKLTLPPGEPDGRTLDWPVKPSIQVLL